MIPIGTLCMIVAGPHPEIMNAYDRTVVGTTCTVTGPEYVERGYLAPFHIQQPVSHPSRDVLACAVVCLRPLTPPPETTIDQREKETTT
jgi:hypothetical protein